MEAVSSLELGGIIYPPCDQYTAGAALAGQAGNMGTAAAMAPGVHVPPGEPLSCIEEPCKSWHERVGRELHLS
jgi:hypothetical protein